MGRNGQEIIDEYIIKSNYDIFIGIMKNRFGHAAKKAGSGTEHEFNDALERKTKLEKSIPRIMFYYGKDEVDIDNPKINEILEQRKKVITFKDSISNNELYIDFNSCEQFEEKLEAKLNMFISELSPITNPHEKIKEVDIILKKLEDKLNQSLISYNELSPVWIEPIISTKREIPTNPTKNEENRVELFSLIEDPTNIIIKATEMEDLQSLKMLSKKCRAKHILKNNNPNIGLINRLDKLEKGSKY